MKKVKNEYEYLVHLTWYNCHRKTCQTVVVEYISVVKTAEKWGISERSVRNYCAQGRITDTKLIGKIWCIP